MPSKKKDPPYPAMLNDDSVPWDHRRRMLMQLCLDSSEEGQQALSSFFKAARTPESAEAACQEKIDELDALLGDLRKGPLREATFLHLATGGKETQRACVILQDGTRAFVVVPESEIGATLRCGDTVLVEPNGRALLYREAVVPETGERAKLERRLDEHRIEVSSRDLERHVYVMSADLQKEVDAEEVEPGRDLLVCPRRMMAFAALPREDGLSHYRFLDRGAVPDVIVERDLGAPPPFIDELTVHIREEMTVPELRREFGLPRCELRFLEGVSGSGKSFSIQALERRMYDVMSELTGAPLADLPRRVMRLRPGQFLSKWFGESDQNLDRFFDEVEQLAAERFTTPGGEVVDLPTLVILEEVDGLARQRGESEIYDRVLTTALQRLDPARSELSNSFLVVVATSNVAHQVDHAFVRRVAGKIEKFGRLRRAAFVSVLAKQVGCRPLASHNGTDPGQLRRELLAQVSSWLFKPEQDDRPLVEVACAGSSQPLLKYRKDFLTASLVERAVLDAARQACAAAGQNGGRGLTAGTVITALDGQIRSVAGLLQNSNIRDYVDLPDGTHVVDVRRVAQPEHLPQQLMGVA